MIEWTQVTKIVIFSDTQINTNTINISLSSCLGEYVTMN